MLIEKAKNKTTAASPKKEVSPKTETKKAEPKKTETDSNYAGMGRYLLTPDIFEYLDINKDGKIDSYFEGKTNIIEYNMAQNYQGRHY